MVKPATNIAHAQIHLVVIVTEDTIIKQLMRHLLNTAFAIACFHGEYPFETHIPMIELQEKEKFAQVWGN